MMPPSCRSGRAAYTVSYHTIPSRAILGHTTLYHKYTLQASIAMRSKQPAGCEQLLKSAAALTGDARIALSLAQLQLQASPHSIQYESQVSSVRHRPVWPESDATSTEELCLRTS